MSEIVYAIITVFIIIGIGCVLSWIGEKLYMKTNIDHPILNFIFFGRTKKTKEVDGS